MERLPYSTRARQRVRRETLTFIKGRTVPLGIGITVIVMGALLHYFWLHQQTTKELITISVVSIGGSYAVWFLAALAINTIRIPWLLDSESGELINAMEARAAEAESKLCTDEKIKQENNRLHDTFGHYVQGGTQFLADISHATTQSELASWDRHLKIWVDDVRSAIRSMGFAADAEEFIRAKDSAHPVSGVMNLGYEQERRRRVLKEHQKNLSEFIQRRLP